MQKIPDKKLWKTKNRIYLDPESMETSHIINCMNMLKSKGYVSKSTYLFYILAFRP